MQGLLIFLILFFIYISRIFEQIEKLLLEVISLLFIDNLRFIISKKSVKKIAKSLEKITKIILKWREENAMTYNMAKTKLILFFYTY